MGLYECAAHGPQGMAFISPELGHAMAAGARWPAHDITRVLYTPMEEQYPPVRAWLSGEQHLGGRVLSNDEAMALETEPECRACVNEWLRSNGVDIGLSPVEQRFVRLETALSELFRPRLEPALTAIADLLFASTREPAGHGLGALVGRPFLAYCDCAPSGRVAVEVRDHGDRLAGSVRSSLSTIRSFPELAVPLVSGELDPAGIEALTRWAEALERALTDALQRLTPDSLITPPGSSTPR